MTKRLFTGISLSKALRDELEEIQGKWKTRFPKSLRWIPKENLHLTFHFLGSVEEERVDSILELLSSVRICPRKFALDEFIAFPNSRRASVIGIGATRFSYIELFTDIGERLKALGFTLEERVFVPHITMARLRDPITVKEAPSFVGVEVEFECVELFESRTVQGESRYTVLGPSRQV